MPCSKPLTAQRLDDGSVSFSAKSGSGDQLTLACGQCLGCRLDRARMWAIRCVHEAEQWPVNCFITLTYDNEHLPEDGSLNYDHFQAFMKRLRKHHKGVLQKDGVNPIRFYMCGEYGDQNRRPHYHAILFNWEPPDLVPHQNYRGNIVYGSEELTRLWGQGFTTSGAVTLQSAGYVARYVMKKITGHQAEQAYERIDPETGEITQLRPEFNVMSRRPGIGSAWIREYMSDVYPHDFVVTKDGKKAKPPRFYDQRYREHDAYAFEDLQLSRFERGRSIPISEKSDERLRVKADVLKARTSKLRRQL